MRLRLFSLFVLVASLLKAAEAPSSQAVAPAKPAVSADASGADVFAIAAKYTNPLKLEPGVDDSRVSKTVARFLQSMHYTRHKFDREIGEKMFDRYIDALDPQKLYFLQTDIDEFAPVRATLDDLTFRQGDTSAAYDIFNRFLTRFDQSYALVIDQLKTGKFSFNAADETYLVNRKDASRAKDLQQAQKLWQERLRFEYLSEKLNEGDTKPLGELFRTNLLAGTFDRLATSLTNKFSPEKAADLAQFAKARFDAAKGKPEQRAKAAMPQVETRLAANQHDEIVKKLARRYQRTLRNLKQFESDEVLQLWLDSLGHAYDPHTDYLGKRELDQFSMSMNLRLFGIGATLQSEDGYTVIEEYRPGTPAEKSKQIKVGDKVVAVAQGKGEFVDVIDEKLTKVVGQIRGEKGSEVRLSIIPTGADSSVRKVVSIIRDEIKLEDSEAKGKLVELPVDNGKTKRVGVIDLPSFYANFSIGGQRGSGKTTTGDVAKLLKKLTAEGAEGIVLDLRRNGGGSLEEAINLAGLFIKSGPVVQIRNYDGSIQVDEDRDDSIGYDGPLVVLTSRFSASASEIVAAALQDYGRAVLVGDSSTHGKGTVQTVQELNQYLRGAQNPGAVKVTIRKFYRASGGSTQLKGVTPDIALPGINSHAEVGETSARERARLGRHPGRQVRQARPRATAARRAHQTLRRPRRQGQGLRVRPRGCRPVPQDDRRQDGLAQRAEAPRREGRRQGPGRGPEEGARRPPRGPADRLRDHSQGRRPARPPRADDQQGRHRGQQGRRAQAQGRQGGEDPRRGQHRSRRCDREHLRPRSGEDRHRR